MDSTQGAEPPRNKQLPMTMTGYRTLHNNRSDWAGSNYIMEGSQRHGLLKLWQAKRPRILFQSSVTHLASSGGTVAITQQSPTSTQHYTGRSYTTGIYGTPNSTGSMG